MNKKGTGTASDFLDLSLLAFAGLGMDILLAFFLEANIYGKDMSKWSDVQNISHSIITSIIWGIISFLIIKKSKNKYSFDIFEKREKIKIFQWIGILIFAIITFIISYNNWNGFKVLKEFVNLGLLKFVFQYIYYIFEAMIFTLIIVFGQKAFEKWFNKKNIPYGGFVVSITWGLIHMFTKGSLQAGLIAALVGLFFGIVYLLTNKDTKKTLIILYFMFVL